MKKRTIKQVTKELESLGFVQKLGPILFRAKYHLTFIVTINHVVIFNFNDVTFRYSERDGTFEYMLDSHYDEVEQGLDIPSMLVLYK